MASLISKVIAKINPVLRGWNAYFAHDVSWAGFVCPSCGGTEAWVTTRGFRHCRQCGRQTSVTAGTLFHRSRMPLPFWFRAIWYVTSRESGASALGLQQLLGLSYETAWQWLHRLRRAMVRAQGDQLRGWVQVETDYVGPKRRPGGPRRTTLVAIAVEDVERPNIARIRLQPLPNPSAAKLERFIKAAIAPGSLILTDSSAVYHRLASLWCMHRVIPFIHILLPYRIASHLTEWLLESYHHAVKPTHLAYYLDEFTFRYNHRALRYPGALFHRIVKQAVLLDPVPGRLLTAASGKRRRG